MNKFYKIFLVLVMIGLVVFLGFYLQKKNQTQKAEEYKSTEFVGSVQKIEQNSMTIKGVYNVPNHPELATTENIVTVGITMSPHTTYTKSIQHIPADRNNFDPSKLKNETVVGSLPDFTLNFSPGETVKVKTTNNIYEKTQFEAAEIEYTQTVTF